MKAVLSTKAKFRICAASCRGWRWVRVENILGGFGCEGLVGGWFFGGERSRGFALRFSGFVSLAGVVLGGLFTGVCVVKVVLLRSQV